jgi:anti-sigma-K factor RsiG
VSGVDRLLAADYLGDVIDRPITEIRSMRDECQAAEASLSYVRRIVQARHDIVAAEIGRRASGGEPADLSALVDKLPEILGQHVVGPGLGRLSAVAPPDDDALVSEVDAVVDSARLAGLSEASDDDVRALADQLAELEASVSGRRRALHERIDTLQAELVRRYKSGEATVESLLR